MTPQSTQHSPVTWLAARHLVMVMLPTGAVIGAAIFAYDYLVNRSLWGNLKAVLPPWGLALMPTVGLLLTGLCVRWGRLSTTSMADDVVRAYHSRLGPTSLRVTLAKLAASMATMGFGAAAGMEGASKWLGASIAAAIQHGLNGRRAFTWAHGDGRITMLAGGAAGIGAIFKAPLTGAIMGVESPYKRDLAHEAVIHALVACAASYSVFQWLASAPPYVAIPKSYELTAWDLFGCLLVGLGAGLAARAYLWLQAVLRDLWSRLPWPLLSKYLLTGASLSALAFISLAWQGELLTLQSGLDELRPLVEGHTDLGRAAVIFGLRLIATAVTFGGGGVGGQFLPSATIGAALGACCDQLLQPSMPGLFALVGICAFTGAAYNGLLFAAVFIAEGSGCPALVVPALLASTVAYLAVGGRSNSPSQWSVRREHSP